MQRYRIWGAVSSHDIRWGSGLRLEMEAAAKPSEAEAFPAFERAALRSLLYASGVRDIPEPPGWHLACDIELRRIDDEAAVIAERDIAFENGVLETLETLPMRVQRLGSYVPPDKYQSEPDDDRAAFQLGVWIGSLAACLRRASSLEACRPSTFLRSWGAPAWPALDIAAIKGAVGEAATNVASAKAAIDVACSAYHLQADVRALLP